MEVGEFTIFRAAQTKHEYGVNWMISSCQSILRIYWESLAQHESVQKDRTLISYQKNGLGIWSMPIVERYSAS